MIRTIDGEPGTYWRNLTPDIYFQWEVFPGCCEVCLRLDRQIVSGLPPRAAPALPVHPDAGRHAGAGAAAVPELQSEALAVRPSEWRVELFGLSNLRLVKAGLVEMDDLLAEDRVRDFAEVVRRRN